MKKSHNNRTQFEISEGEKEQILQECAIPNSNRKEIARKYGIPYTTLMTWIGKEKPEKIMDRGLKFRDMIKKAHEIQNTLLGEILDDLQDENKQISFRDKLTALEKINQITSKHIDIIKDGEPKENIDDDSVVIPFKIKKRKNENTMDDKETRKGIGEYMSSLS